MLYLFQKVAFASISHKITTRIYLHSKFGEKLLSFVPSTRRWSCFRRQTGLFGFTLGSFFPTLLGFIYLFDFRGLETIELRPQMFNGCCYAVQNAKITEKIINKNDRFFFLFTTSLRQISWPMSEVLSAADGIVRVLLTFYVGRIAS